MISKKTKLLIFTLLDEKLCFINWNFRKQISEMIKTYKPKIDYILNIYNYNCNIRLWKQVYALDNTVWNWKHIQNHTSPYFVIEPSSNYYLHPVVYYWILPLHTYTGQLIGLLWAGYHKLFSYCLLKWISCDN